MGIFRIIPKLTFYDYYHKADRPFIRGWASALADFINEKFTDEDTLELKNIKFVDGDNEFRFRFADNTLYLDIKLTDTGWDGDEDTDWETLTSFKKPS